jgi:UTP--glucose-1-phosphate uridylyltransferase
VEPPAAEDVVALPEPGSEAYEEARAAGLDALREGRVAAVVLAGGMATRFGGVVKGVVEVLDGRSFLEWKLGETAELASALGAEIPVALMTSFSTDEETRAHVVSRGVPEPLWFTQYVSLRLEPDGSPFRDDEGRVSPYGPGHGDLVEALPASGTAAELRRRGVEIVTVSNVDNLGARVDPVVVGAHVLGGAPLTIEVARKQGDMGGAPARVDGRAVLLEAPRFPPGFDHDRIAVFNTNTAVVDLDVFDGAYDLRWLYVEKDVDGRAAVQLERLYHELSWFVETRFLEVPRSGPRGRFFPIKTPDDLARAEDDLREMLATPLA